MLTLTAVCLAFAAIAPAASAATKFRPRIGNALGLIPPVNSQGNFNTEPTENGVLNAVTYHGGSVMTGGVEVHTIFWAPAGYAFQGAPGNGAPSYEGMIEKFFTDVSADSGPAKPSNCTTATDECNIFSTLTQYGQGTTPGSVKPGDYAITYSASNANDVIQDTDPYPTNDCTSPQDASACVLDSSVQQEVDKVASAHGNGRGLHNLWYVFLPPDVDECISPNVCGTNAFGGYHSLMNVNGHGVTIYAVTIDPLIEIGGQPSGIDPNGNPDAELTVDIAGHETNEAMTDPEGVGWMDPNGYEVADKCEFGPQRGTPLGYAGPDHAPYNQVINGDYYLTQEIWSNDGNASHPVPSCVQGTQDTSDPLPLPQVSLTQFSPTVTGTVYKGGVGASGVTATVSLIRTDANGNPVTVSKASSAPTGAGGTWSVTLSHPVGDDRDEITIDYAGANAPTPNHQVILTGNGGNPFTESGWTGWTALDSGYALQSSDPTVGGHPSLTIAPCFQTGVESYTFNGTTEPTSPTDFCGTASDAADLDLTLNGIGSIGKSSVFTVTTNDNRAFQAADTATPNQVGGLVSMTVPVGEPDSFSSFVGQLPGFTATGLPTCTADLGMQTVSCTGLVPGGSYTIADGSHHASGTATGADSAPPVLPGTVTEPLAIRRGDTVTLSNGSRVLTTLHVANLQVHIMGDGDAVASGKCTPDLYWGGPLNTAPTNLAAGEPSSLANGGAAGTGEICPASGNASGLPTSSIAQTDERSGGQTVTEVADVADTSPVEGETVYGTFTALAEATDGSSPIGVRITKASNGHTVFRATNVDSANGVKVKNLAPGTYNATWTVTNPNGDTRTEMTRFIQASALGGSSASKPKVTCTLTNNNRIKCEVSFPKSKSKRTMVRMTVARGGHVVALGHGAIKHDAATVTMRLLRRVGAGSLAVTLVVSAPHAKAVTERASARLG